MNIAYEIHTRERLEKLAEIEKFLQNPTPEEVNKTDDRGRTRLMWAAFYGRADLCKRLVMAGADMDIQSAPSDHRLSALMLTVRFGNIETLNFFLYNGADYSLRDTEGKNIYDYLQVHEKKLSGMKKAFEHFLTGAPSPERVTAHTYLCSRSENQNERN